MRSVKETTIRCTCGQVEIQLRGTPILTAVCHCDDCQRASSELEQFPNAPKILDQAGGTAYVLYRKDRVRCNTGNTLLKAHRTPGEKSTARFVAACCNSAMYLDFEPGHWLSLFRDRFGNFAPPIQMRTQTKYAQDPSTIPKDAPQFRSYSPGFVFRLIGSKLAMTLARNKPRSDKSYADQSSQT